MNRIPTEGNRQRGYWALLLLAAGLCIAAWLADRNHQDAFMADERASVHHELMRVHSLMESHLFGDIQRVNGLASLISLYPDLTQPQFEKAAGPLFDSSSSLRNVGAAPDLVIRLIYPIAGNEAAIGFDYRSRPEQLRVAEQVRASRKVGLAGPIKLVQGGIGLVVELPVFMSHGEGEEQFWGLVSAVVDMDAFYEKSTLMDEGSPIAVAIRHQPDDAMGAVFFGDAALFDDQPVLMNVELPGGGWQLAARPRDGWPQQAMDSMQFRGLLLLIGLLILLPLYFLFKTSGKLTQAEAERDEERQRLYQTLESTPNVAVQWYDRDGRVLFWNGASEKVYGYSAQEAQGKRLDQLIFTTQQHCAFIERLQRLSTANAKPDIFELLVKHRDGSERFVYTSLFAIGASDQPIYVCMDVDISERKQIELNLQQREEDIRLIADYTYDWESLFAPDGTLLWTNPAVERLTGHSITECMERSSFPCTIVHEDDREAFSHLLRQSLAEQSLLNDYEFRIYHKDGSTHWVATSWQPCYGSGGDYTGLRTSMRDITERKQAENALRASEEKLRGLFELSPLGIALTDMDGRYIEFNDAFARICGYPVDELYGLDYWTLTPKKYMTDEVLQLESLQQCGRYGPYEKEYMQKDGVTIPVQLNGIVVEGDDGSNYIWSIVEDISARKQTENMLRLAATAFDTREAIIITDTGAQIISVNRAFSEITGYSADEVIGRRPNLLSSGKHDTAFYAMMWGALIHEGHWVGEVINRRKNGEIYPEQLSITASRNELGEVVNYIGVFSDISEKKELEKKLRQAQKMDAVGTLVGGIAHEFNNMLAGISGNIYLARLRAGGDGDLCRYLDTSEKICFSAAKMIKQLLVFSRKDFEQHALEPVNLTAWLDEGIELCRPAIPSSIEIQRVSRDEGALIIHADPTQLQQILMNLINNARDACAHRDKPLIQVELDSGRAEAAFRQRHKDFIGYEYVRLTVRDNGSGIAPDQLDKIFEPFFTTKDVGKGTGLGMPVIQGLVESYHGCIEVQSTVDAGSCFQVYFPRHAPNETAKVVVEQPIGSALQGYGEMVLVADDEPEVLKMVCGVLQMLGYRVLHACDGLAAVELFEVEQERIDMLLLDVMMPRLSGSAAALRMRQLRPDIPVLFYTGYNPDAMRDEMGELRNYQMIAKPIQVNELSRVVRSMLDHRRES